MKKYTDKHLESVPPEFIVAAQTTIGMLKGDIGHMYGADTCPAVILCDPDDDNYACGGEDPLCSKYLIYSKKFPVCPCWKFGEEKCIKLLTNLITQWKKWANLED